MKLEFSQQSFEKSTNTKFQENPSSESRVVPCGRTDMTKLIVTKALKNRYFWLASNLHEF